MGRNSSGGSKKRSASASASGATSSTNLNSVTEKLKLLRNFVHGSAGEWSEAELTDCLRQCAYSVERAAECLITGQYKGSTKGKKKSAFFHLSSSTTCSSSSSSSSASAAYNSISATTARNNQPKKKQIILAATTATKSKERRTPTLFRKGAAAAKQKKKKAPPSSLKPAPPPPATTYAAAATADSNSNEQQLDKQNVGLKAEIGGTGTNTASGCSSPPSSPSSSSWLLCQRWISHAICTTRNAKLGYREKLELTHTRTGHPCVRFRGKYIEGRLPDNLASLLAPVLRYNKNDPDNNNHAAKNNNGHHSNNNNPLIRLEGEALMEEDRIAVGALVPISIHVYIEDPRAFFQLFENESTKEISLNMFFDKCNNKQPASKNKRKCFTPAAGAAFGLLQWAEYGDVMEFETPPATAEATEAEGDGEDGDDKKANATSSTQEDTDDGIEMSEKDFEEEASVMSTEEANRLGSSVTTGNDEWATTLPEADNPPGFTDGITLRSYQKQALYWMMKREQEGESREELEEQLALLSELASEKKNASPSASGFHGQPTGKQDDVFCDCGPVVVSEQAQKKSKTVDGEINPLNHPLWKQRFLASTNEMNETISFYVNELTGVATHRPPAPPSPCSGGILADDMGLGKTVMLLSVVLKSKAEREAAAATEDGSPKTTLIVAKLSLLPQWEEEIKTKTSLTYLVYYGQGKSPSAEEISNVDCVITTYGTIQGELKRKKPVLMENNWLRVILDEAHCVRNENTLASKVCSKLNAIHRWCATGTVIQNSLNDVYGIMKFLKHEPWCFSSFWKAAISRPFSTDEMGSEGSQVALGRVRRLLSPLMLRRTKDSLTKDGKPILSLPPVETKTVNVQLSDSEREFYNAVLEKSQALFDGYVDKGTLGKSYFQVFSLLQRLRQVCDHIALTVRSRMASVDLNEALLERSVQEDAEEEALGQTFFEGLLGKFCAQQQSSPNKTKNCDEQDDDEKPALKRPKQQNAYLSQQAHFLTQAVQDKSNLEECPICLEEPKIEEAVFTPCAHIFCRKCLLGYLSERTTSQKSENKPCNGNVFDCPDGECPVCNEKIDAKRIIAVSSKLNQDGSSTMATEFLPNLKTTKVPQPFDCSAITEGSLVPAKKVARDVLEEAVGGSASSKMTAIFDELMSIWQVDPGSKVLLFSHYLGFLDLLATQLEQNQIDYLRLDGTLSLKGRMDVLEKFRASGGTAPFEDSSLDEPEEFRKGKVLLMSMAAGGEGLNLVTASSVFICEPWWNVAREDQCVNRIHRIGQTADVVRVRKFVVADSVEERIVDLQGRKKYVADEIYSSAAERDDANSGGGSKLSLEDFKLIFRK